MKDTKSIYYTYTHTRLDTGDVFYVGISRRYNKFRAYTRAYEFKGYKKRNILWNKIYNKCKGRIKVDIVLESKNIDIVFKKEIELISFYGKIIDKKGGTLANISNGGEHKSAPSKPITQYNKYGFFVKTWPNVYEAAFILNIKPETIRDAIREQGLCDNKHLFRYTSDGLIKIDSYIDRRLTAVDCYYTTTNKFFKTFISIREASRFIGIDSSSITNCVNKKRMSAGGFYWVKSGDKIEFPEPSIIIHQYSLSGILLKVYNSYAEIQKDFKLKSVTAIRNCFCGKQTKAYGYKWKLIK